MFVQDLLNSIKGDNLEIRNDDDRADRLNYRWTVVVLIIFAGLVTAETYLMQDRIKCWVPAHFKGGWENYVNDYCWIQNTYFLPWEEHVPMEPDIRNEYPIVYYQWVPLFLLVQAMFFYAPIVLWRTLNHRTGIDINDIVESAEQVQKSEDEEMRSKWMSFLTRQMDRYLMISKKPVGKDAGPCSAGSCNVKWFLSACCFCCMGRRFGNYMTLLYILVKVLFCINVVGQIFILNKFLGRNFSMYGIQLIQSWISGESLEESPYFPRVTFCDVEVRRLGNLHRYTVQCVLPINMFNEKIYAFLWFWFFLVATLTFFNLITWLGRIFFQVDSYRYIKKHLQVDTPQKAFDPNRQTDRDRLKVFLNHYLRPDGVLVLRIVDSNTNKVTVEDLISLLWIHFLKKRYDYKEIEEKKDEEKPDTPDREPPHYSSAASAASTDTDHLLPPSAPDLGTAV